MLHGAIGKNWVTLAGDFTPTLNTEDDPTTLKANESPACYGIDAEKDGRLAVGGLPGYTWATLPIGGTGYTAWTWLYNRLWYFASAGNSTTLLWGGPWYRDLRLPHEAGEIVADNNITRILPISGGDLLVMTGSGSQVIPQADALHGQFRIGHVYQGFYGATTDPAISLDGTAYVCNSKGVFSFDGKETKELTRKIRGTLGTFANPGNYLMGAELDKKYIVLLNVGVVVVAMIEIDSGKLFDYGTSGFLFTTRTLANPPSYSPFEIDKIAFSIEHGSTAGGTIQWQTKSEDGAWKTEPAIAVPYTDEKFTRIEVPIQESPHNCHKFAIRLTSLSSNIYIRTIQVCAVGLAEEHASK